MQISGGGTLERTGGLEPKCKRQTYFLAAMITLAQVVSLLARSSRVSLHSQMDSLKGARQGVGMLVASSLGQNGGVVATCQQRS